MDIQERLSDFRERPIEIRFPISPDQVIAGRGKEES